MKLPKIEAETEESKKAFDQVLRARLIAAQKKDKASIVEHEKGLIEATTESKKGYHEWALDTLKKNCGAREVLLSSDEVILAGQTFGLV